MDYNTIINDDCLHAMQGLEDNTIDSIVTDPPYGLSFMGKDWDHGIPGVVFWQEALRIAKPGCHLLAFGGTRTFHRLAVAIEDAGWEIRDTVMWVYGSGFPKSHNLKGAWQGYGTALKPAWEPVIVARKPLEGTVANNVLKWGTGALNIDGCRVLAGKQPGKRSSGGFNSGGNSNCYGDSDGVKDSDYSSGRFPANLIHDGSDEVVSGFPNDTSRFFYCAKASKSERNMGCEGLEMKETKRYGDFEGTPEHAPKKDVKNTNNHPTVKPIALMRYLVRLVTPPDGVVLDPFCGSGSTLVGALREGFRYLGIEKDPDYVNIAYHRTKGALKEMGKEAK